MCSLSLAEALDRGQYLVGGLGPFEGLWVLVVAVDEGADVGLQLPDRGMNPYSPDEAAFCYGLATIQI